MIARDENKAWESLGPAIQRTFVEAMRDVFAGYYAGENTRYLPTPPGTNPLGSGADYHYRNESQYLRMIERARYFDRDNMVVGQGVTRLIANVLQDGFTLDPDTGDSALDDELRNRWWEWAEDPRQCDDEQERTWAEMEQLALRAVIVDGDIFAVPLSSGALQWFEGHACRNPYGSRNSGNLIHGVELTGRRRRAAYWLTPDEISPMASPQRGNAFARVPVDLGEDARVIHLCQRKRMSQTRGVTAFAPSVIPIQYHDDLQFATLLKAKAASFVALFHELAIDAAPGGARPRGSRTTETQDDGSTRVIEKSGLATEVYGRPGETLKGFAPNIPNPEFFPHASLVLTIVSINLDLPLQVFLLDPSKSNFSSWRGAIDQARMRMRQIQQWQASRLHCPVYRWKVRQWLTTDFAMRSVAERSGVDVFAHTWKPPRWPYIEPLTDAQADHYRIAKNLAPASVVFGDRGFEYDVLLPRIIDDRARLIEAACERAAAINERYPFAEVDWREVAYGSINDTTATTVAALTARETSPIAADKNADDAAQA